ncbi:hypothetical protein [Paraburkholderia lacunae]|uniref:Uncharacterized protein n=1 Tax=Paraburkholderia lacunae TaxID=2211104 RepID=A0A370MVA8_9BURK|nr:hypothetical protein [Paraburkholderia lacunae]RDJ97303.1 hypothetical protein DLM46_38210 [Paraburkholderia lacunae]
MNQPQALIKGDLAFPKLRPFDGVPPPFGSRRRAAQQSMRGAIQRTANPAHRGPLGPGVKHVLFYKTPPQRVDSHRFDVAMAEAKRYLDLETCHVRARSSRSDHVGGAAIFVCSSIALAWLLATCATQDAGTQPELAKKLPESPAISSLAVGIPQRPAKLTQRDTERVHPSSAMAASVASAAPPATLAKAVNSNAADVAPVRSEASDAVPMTPPANRARSTDSMPVTASRSPRTQLSTHVSQQPPARATTHEPTRRAAKVDRTPAPARLTLEHVDKRLALKHAVRPADRPSVSIQPEWTGRGPAEGDAIDQAPWLNWSAQPPRSHAATRATVPADTNWNARMTQRRITDDPTAFLSGTTQK